MRTLILCAALVALSGCASWDELDARECTSMGAPPGSPQYFDCRAMIAQRRQAGFAMMGAMGMQMQQNAHPQYQPTGNTTCTRVGTSWNYNCMQW